MGINIKKTILFFEPSSGFGGSASALFHLLSHLDKEKYSFLVVYTNKGAFIEKIETLGIECRVLPYKEVESNFLDIIKSSLWLKRVIKQKKVSVVHINTNIMTGLPALIAAKLSGVPCVCHIRQTRQLIRREILCVRWINKVIVLNNNAYDLCRKSIPEGKLIVIHDGIDCDAFLKDEVSTFRSEFNLNANFLVGLVGRIVRGKGQKEFVLAAEKVMRVCPGIKFVIVGDAKGDTAHYYEEIKDLIDKNKLGDRVILAGWRNDVKNVISDLDVLVQASTTFPEGLPNIIIEAMALKKPVVATKIAGSMDIVVDNETGFLVAPGNVDAMAEKIVHLFQSSSAAEQMGLKGRKRVKELFDIKRCVRKIEELVYEKL